MSTDAQSLYSSASCFLCFCKASEAELLGLALWSQVATSRGIVNTDPQSLLSAAQCYVCEGVSVAQALKLELLAKISLAHNPANQVDPQSLLSQAKCFACFSTASIGKLMELALLAQIAS